jgi:hypothetical protein
MGRKVEVAVIGALILLSVLWIGSSYYLDYKKSQSEPVVDQLMSEGIVLTELDSICAELISLTKSSVTLISDYRLSILLRRSTECESSSTQQKLVLAEQTRRDLQKSKARSTEATTRQVTIDGYDSEAGVIVDRVNLWKSYKDRTKGIAGAVSHGDRVKMLEQSGDGVLIESRTGVRGWVTYFFIKELK